MTSRLILLGQDCGELWFLKSWLALISNVIVRSRYNHDQMAEPRPGRFSAYLEYSQRNARSLPAPVSEPTSLLTKIGRVAPNSMRMSDLAERSQMSATMFHETLQKLADEGFIELSGSRYRKQST